MTVVLALLCRHNTVEGFLFVLHHRETQSEDTGRVCEKYYEGHKRIASDRTKEEHKALKTSPSSSIRYLAQQIGVSTGSARKNFSEMTCSFVHTKFS
jgi:hypothetical protein